MVRNTSKFECGICPKTREHDQAKGHNPLGWRIREVNGKRMILCEACGSDAAWNGGASGRIKELFRERYGEELRDD